MLKQQKGDEANPWRGDENSSQGGECLGSSLVHNLVSGWKG